MNHLFRGIAYYLALILVNTAVASSALPSDEIRHIAPPATIDLQHVDPAVAKLYDARMAV